MSVGGLLKKYNFELANVISYPNVIASALYSQEIITRTCLEEASNETMIASNRAIKLLLAVTKTLESEPTKFQDFLDVLKAELPHVNSLIDQMQLEYDKLDKKRASIRRRLPDNTTSTGPKESENEEDSDEEDVSTSDVIRVVIKGIGSVMVLTLVLWLVFLFFYKPPDNSINDALKQPADDTSKPCHRTCVTAMYEELQTDISDAITLGIHFGLSKVQRDIINKEKQTEKEKLIEVLSVCHDSNKCSCWEDVTIGLEKYGNIRKAEAIRKKFILD